MVTYVPLIYISRLVMCVKNLKVIIVMFDKE